MINDSLAQSIAGLGWAYRYLMSEQPLYVVSESAETTVYCRERGFKRDSSEKVIIFKTTNEEFISSGYGMICKTSDGLAVTDVTEYGTIIIQQRVTPLGNTVYIGIMGSRWNDKYSVNVTIDDAKTIIPTGISTHMIEQNIAMNQFILNLADSILF